MVCVFSTVRIREVIFIFFFTIVFYAWICVFQDHDFLRIIGVNVFRIFGSLVSLIWLWFVYRKQNNKERYFWLLLGIGCFFYLIAYIFWGYYQIILQVVTPYPSWADLFWLMASGIFLIALIYQMKVIRSTYPMISFVFNIAIFMTMAISLSGHFIFQRILSNDTEASLVSLVYPILDLGLLFATVGLYLVFREYSSPRVLLIIICGFCFLISADTVYTYFSLRGTYVMGSFIEPLWTLTVLLVGLAGLYSLELPKTKEKVNNTAHIYHGNLISYISVGVLLYINKISFDYVEIGLLITMLLVITRQVLIQNENKNLLTQLKQQETKYRLIAENMSDLIVVVGSNGMIQYASPSLQTVLGFEPETYIGDLIFKIVHQNDIPYVKEQFNEIVSSKLPHWLEFKCKKRHGGCISVDATVTPALNKDGETDSIILVARDISARKKAEEMLRKSEKLAVSGQLAAAVAHEIRNPMTSLKGFIQLAKEGHSSGTYYEIMLSELERIENIINDFLLLAKPNVKNFQIQNLNKILRHVVTLLSSQAIINSVQIITECEDDISQVYGEENLLKQVFVNLIKNAIEATPNGGKVNVRLKKINTSIIIEIIDKGSGIPDTVMQKLGEPFYSTKEKGTGLGLMISYQIIEEHKGMIKIKSEKGEGTIVQILLPAS
jgi:PAS domain S-box-containing protein